MLKRALRGWGADGFFLRSSPFNDTFFISNELNFGWIHLAGEYL
jgi:hypothetical protein